MNVLSSDHSISTSVASPFFGLDTAAGLLGVQGRQILLNKEYLIYGEDYTGFGSQSSSKGQVLVLIEPDQIRTALRDRVDGEASLKLMRRGQTVLETGEAWDRVFSIPSAEDRTVAYEISLPGTKLASLLPVSAWIPLAVMIGASLFFLLLIYRNSLRYYRPIENIHQLVDSPSEGRTQAAEEKKSDEFDAIMQGISSLIGERNGYRERMVTITPYARQGMLQAAMRGAGHTGTLVDFFFYDSVTTHDSSLSMAVFSLLANEIGETQTAYDYFMSSARLDLDDMHHNTKDGLHMANMAGTWTGLAEGFGGMRCRGGELSFAPVLPPKWQGYRFRVFYRGRCVEACMGPGGPEYRLVSGEPITIRSFGQELELR